MIDLITGLPGNCKTLYTIAWLRDFAKKENRQVFYSGIPLTDQGKEELGWIEIDPLKWMDAPPNSIVVIDEAQRVFRNRTLGTVPGPHVTELETHRHNGIDLVFITQHPSLIDPAIRKLTQRHRHMVRIMGMRASTVNEWNGVRDDCDKPMAKKVSEKSRWKFDKSIYPLYKSAEVHTVKRNIPMRMMLIPIIPLAFGVVIYNVVSYIKGKAEGKRALTEQAAQQQQPGQNQFAQFRPDEIDPVQDAKQYVFKETPRVVGLEYTAPKYDELTRPSSVPVPAMCVQTKTRCKCYSQQATPLAVPLSMCINFANNGYFQEFAPDGEGVNVDRQHVNATPVPQMSKASTPQSSPVDASGYGVLGKVGPGVRVPGQS